MALVEGNRTADRRIPASSSYSFSHNQNTGSDRCLVIIVAAPVTSVSSITYGGQSLTNVRQNNTPYSTYWSVWRLLSPPTGTNTVSVNLSSSNYNGVSTVCYSFTGSSGVGNTSYNGTQTIGPTTNLTISPNSMIIGSIIAGNSTGAYIQIPQGTSRPIDWNHNINNYTFGGISPSLTSGTKTIKGGSTTANAIILGIEVKESTPPPTLSRTPTSLSGFTYIEGSGPSSEQTFTVSGDNLTSNVTVTAPTNYEVSLTSGSGFASSVVLTQSGGNVVGEPKTVYVRLKSGLTVNTYTGNINITSTGATTLTVALSGSVTAVPTLSRTPTSLSGFTYIEGSGPSSEQTFTVSGDNLTSNVTVTAPTNYEVSLTSGSGFASSVVLTQSGGNVVGEPKTVYVRLKSGLAVNTYTGNINITSTGATTLTIALSGDVTGVTRRRIIIV